MRGKKAKSEKLDSPNERRPGRPHVDEEEVERFLLTKRPQLIARD
jgi:hypothetical protein